MDIGRAACGSYLEQRDKQLRVLADALPALVAEIDAEQRYCCSNATYEKWFGTSPEWHQTVEDFLSASLYEHCRPYIEFALRGERVRFETTLAEQAGQHERHVEVNYIPRFDPHGNPDGFYALVNDITEYKHTEYELRERQHKGAQAERLAMIGEMTATLAHELNQPLNAIINYAGALRKMLTGNGFDHKLEILDKIIRQSDRGADIIQRVRDFIKSEPVEKTMVDGNAVVYSALELTGSKIYKLGANARCKLADALPKVMANRVQIEQVLVNLIVNALEAMYETREDNRQLILRSSVDLERGRVNILVEDNGLGVNNDNVSHVFDPFYTTKTDGMGMGLAISRSIIEAHHGQLNAECLPQCGMRFSIWLPIASER